MNRTKKYDHHFRVLGLNIGANTEQITNAYKDLSSRSTGAKLAEINRAYDVIKDENLRLAYINNGDSAVALLRRQLDVTEQISTIVKRLERMDKESQRLRKRNEYFKSFKESFKMKVEMLTNFDFLRDNLKRGDIGYPGQSKESVERKVKSMDVVIKSYEEFVERQRKYADQIGSLRSDKLTAEKNNDFVSCLDYLIREKELAVQKLEDRMPMIDKHGQLFGDETTQVVMEKVQCVQNSILPDMIEECKKVLTIQETNVNDLKRQLCAERERVAELEGRLSARDQKELAELNRQIGDLQQQLVASDNALTVERKNFATLRQQLVTAIDKVKRMERQLDDCNRDAITGLNKQISDLQLQLQNETTKSTNLERELGAERGRIVELEQRHGDQKQEELAKLNKQIEDLQKQSGLEIMNSDNLQHQLNHEKQQIENLQQRFDAERAKVKSLKQKLDNEQSKAKSLEGQLARVQNSNVTQEVLAAEKTKVFNLEKLLHTEQDRSKSLTQQLTHLQNSGVTLETLVAEQARVKLLKQKLDNEQSKTKSLEEQLARVQKSNVTQEVLAAEQAKVKSLEGQLDTEKANLVNLHDQLNAEKQNVIELRESLATKDEKIRILEQQPSLVQDPSFSSGVAEALTALSTKIDQFGQQRSTCTQCSSTTQGPSSTSNKKATSSVQQTSSMQCSSAVNESPSTSSNKIVRQRKQTSSMQNSSATQGSTGGKKRTATVREFPLTDSMLRMIADYETYFRFYSHDEALAKLAEYPNIEPANNFTYEHKGGYKPRKLGVQSFRCKDKPCNVRLVLEKWSKEPAYFLLVRSTHDCKKYKPVA